MGRILSVEIKNRNIKILEGSRSGSSVIVYKSLLVDLESGSIDDGKIMDMDSIVATLGRALVENNIKTKNANFIINTNSTITRNMDLPLLKSKSETMSMVKSELSQLLPVDLDQYKLVYKKTENVIVEGIEKGRYTVYGIPKNIYDEYLQLAERLKLDLKAIDLASNCLDKIAEQKITINKEYLKSGEAVAFIDIGYSYITFSVVSNGKDVFTRISQNGVNDLIKNYSTVFNLSQEEAINEILKTELTDYDENNTETSKTSVLEDNVSMWSDEFNRYIRYYNSNNKDLLIQKIYVYGTYSKIAGLEKYFERNLNLKTEIINELSNVVIKIDSKSNAFDIRSYMNTVLSVYINKNDINFLSDKKRKHSSNFNTGVALMTIGAAVILTAAYYGYSYYVEKTSLERDIAAIEKYITDAENIKLNNEAIQIKNKALLLQTYMDEIDKLTTSIKNEDAVNTIIFEQVAAAMPVGTKINSMSVDKASLQLQCSSATRQEVAQFEKNLKTIEFIDNVYVPAVVDIAEGSNTTYSYSVVCEIKDVIANEAE